MPRSLKTCLTLMAMLAGGALLGCSGGASPMNADSHAADKDHHEGGGHDHGHEHAHPAEGPHHGQLIELGKEEYHAELTHDDASRTVAIYVLDNEAKAAVPIEAKEVTINLVVGGKPSQFTLPAAPQESDPAGQASRFQLADEKLCESLDAEGATGRLNLEIGGKPFTGEVAHHDHADHKH
jgi:hypothetical protein